MIMNYVISICPPDTAEVIAEIYENLSLPFCLTFRAKGTAVSNMLELLGIENNEKRAVVTVCTKEKTRQIIKEEKNKTFIGVPGQGIIVSVPVKSVGGGKTVEYLSGGEAMKGRAPELDLEYELIVVIANEGRTDVVMDAARGAGATGGTVLHGKGTGKGSTENFFSVSIATEKEVILIVAKKEEKAKIMRAIVEKAGAGTEANAITFSLPVTEIAGFGFNKED